MEFHRYLENAEGFDRLFKLDRPLVYRESFFLQCIGNHLGCDGAEELVVFADFHRNCDGEFFELNAEFFRILKLLLFLAVVLLLFFFQGAQAANEKVEFKHPCNRSSTGN